jgi:hypothetical protein
VNSIQTTKGFEALAAALAERILDGRIKGGQLLPNCGFSPRCRD